MPISLSLFIHLSPPRFSFFLGSRTPVNCFSHALISLSPFTLLNYLPPSHNPSYLQFMCSINYSLDFCFFCKLLELFSWEDNRGPNSVSDQRLTVNFLSLKM
ncbi:hypothetical protein Ancab_019275 [Ancistrocladus abbreviatus]